MASALVAGTDTPGFVVRVNISGRVPHRVCRLMSTCSSTTDPDAPEVPELTPAPRASYAGSSASHSLCQHRARGRAGPLIAPGTGAVMPITAPRANLTRILLSSAGSDYSAIYSDSAISGKSGHHLLRKCTTSINYLLYASPSRSSLANHQFRGLPTAAGRKVKSC